MLFRHLLLMTLGLSACGSPGPAKESQSARDPLGPQETAPDVPEPLPSQWRQVGKSFEGRPLLAADFGQGPRRIYLLAGIHGDERTGLEALPQLRELLRDSSLLRGLRLRIFADANPDGSDAHTRANARGVDLNRNFPAGSFRARHGHGSEALSEQEARIVLADIDAFDPDLVIVLHASRRGPFVNYDGPAQEAAELFARGAQDADERWHVQPHMGYETPGSLGALLGVDRGLPTLTIEFLRGQSGEEGWPAFEGGLRELLGGMRPPLPEPASSNETSRR